MAADKVDAGRQILLGQSIITFLELPRSVTTPAWRQVGGQDFQQFPHRHNGGSQDDDVGVCHGVEQAVFHLVESLGALGGGADAAVGVGADHFQVEQLGLAQGQGQDVPIKPAPTIAISALPNLPGGCPRSRRGNAGLYLTTILPPFRRLAKGRVDGGGKAIRLVCRQGAW